MKILHKLSESDLAAASGSAGMSCACSRYVLLWIFSLLISFSCVTKTKQEIWKFSLPGHGFPLPSLYLITFRVGFLAWESAAAALSRHCTRWFPRHCLISRGLLAQVLIGTIFCPHLLGATCPVPPEPPGGTWGRFTQVDSKLVMANTISVLSASLFWNLEIAHKDLPSPAFVFMHPWKGVKTNYTSPKYFFNLQRIFVTQTPWARSVLAHNSLQ